MAGADSQVGRTVPCNAVRSCRSQPSVRSVVTSLHEAWTARGEPAFLAAIRAVTPENLALSAPFIHNQLYTPVSSRHAIYGYRSVHRQTSFDAG